jgi:hypothetical protein
MSGNLQRFMGKVSVHDDKSGILAMAENVLCGERSELSDDRFDHI